MTLTREEMEFPADRRLRLWLRPSLRIALVVIVLAPVLVAWGQYLLGGLPHLDPHEAGETGPHGFPGWLRYAHYFNLLFMVLIVRAGLSILMDHPRLYFNVHCTPGSEWIRFTPQDVPRD